MNVTVVKHAKTIHGILSRKRYATLPVGVLPTVFALPTEHTRPVFLGVRVDRSVIFVLPQSLTDNDKSFEDVVEMC
ncbi:hypothetical protein HYPSUDRAFT_43422 [Hypholoma sublateritium FD-334 SS-4]|uniref:Uncharacterized protein n=1 Tax=Hypholoma sublateritium (strain FD-334 SS-4) TaxID=945553 RepID=A0A0D2PJZ3_HYPSF|nr:hypothetical protein HYPSUDRAFT_43422 [Hypholoma sublateritium FD-334 SS-4]